MESAQSQLCEVLVIEVGSTCGWEVEHGVGIAAVDISVKFAIFQYFSADFFS